MAGASGAGAGGARGGAAAAAAAAGAGPDAPGGGEQGAMSVEYQNSILWRGEDPTKRKLQPKVDASKKTVRYFPGKAPRWAEEEKKAAAAKEKDDEEVQRGWDRPRERSRDRRRRRR